MQDLIHSSAGFLNESLLKIPNRRFVPDCLIQSVVGGGNLSECGCRINHIQGSSIAFDAEQSQKAALGEFVERYAAGIYHRDDFIVGSMRSLREQYRFIELKHFRYYNDKQYHQLQKFGITPLSEDDVIEWTEMRDFIGGERYLMPAFCVYMPFENAVNANKEFMVGATSTGIAAGENLERALFSAFCECAERHAFAQFWYRQDRIDYKQYSRELILTHYKQDAAIQRLFKNPRVLFKVFDLCNFAPIETMVVFLYFDYKGHRYQSLGCAARLTKREALLKATLEAYQGVEYAISLMDKKILPETMDISQIHNFDAHFHFYNQYPQCRQASKILREAQNFQQGDNEIYHHPEKETLKFSPECLKKLGLPYLLYKDITPIDVASISYCVVRAITPSWALLTGQHAWPFLGQVFQEEEELFLAYPHPFP
nr:YcaO-like family protein [Bacteroidales bacterium]